MKRNPREISVVATEILRDTCGGPSDLRRLGFTAYDLGGAAVTSRTIADDGNGATLIAQSSSAGCQHVGALTVAPGGHAAFAFRSVCSALGACEYASRGYWQLDGR